MRHVVVSSLAILLTPALASARPFIILTNGQGLPPGIEKKLAAAGAKVTGSSSTLGAVFVDAADDAAISKVAGVSTVIQDLEIQMVEPPNFATTIDGVAAGAALPAPDTYQPLQWGLQAVHASEAWARGNFGKGVRVAVLDAGMAVNHSDLAPNINLALSTSFVPGEGIQPPPGVFNHGTHVAGIIAGAQNGTGIVGVAPKAELVAVKVLRASGSGSFSWLAEGLVYAADNNVDVVNMSLGAQLAGHNKCDADGNCFTGRDISGLQTFLTRATNYAYQHGVTLIASAGNDATDFDHTADTVDFPAMLPHVVAISATGPVGWAIDPTTTLDHPASYSNFGSSVIAFAAPGGDFILPGNQVCAVPVQGGSVVNYCWVFDMVFSAYNVNATGGSQLGWAAGTSMAAPHVSGVAALIIAANGGKMQPAQVAAAIAKFADDLGKPGNDPFYGKGRAHVPH